MRTYILVIVVICCSLFRPVFAAESPEALSIRVTELEKANFIVQEELARTRIELDQVIGVLQQTLSSLDAKTSAQNVSLQGLVTKTQKDLHDNIDALQQHLTQEESTREELAKNTAATDTALQADIIKQKALLTTVQDAITGTKGDLTAQKALLASMQDAITSQNKDVQTDIEVMKKLIGEDKAKNSSEMEDRIAMLEKAITELADRTPTMGFLNSGDMLNVKGVLDLHKLARVEVYRLRFTNNAKGEIAVSRDQGASWQTIGHVVSPAENINEEKLPRQWVPIDVVASTTVNAITIRTGFDVSSGSAKGITFAILPKVTSSGGASGPSASLLPDAAIQTDIPAGDSIFGDKWSPFLGNPVYVETPGGLKQIPTGYAPKRGDSLVIPVLQPKKTPKAFVFENCYGGFVSVEGWDGQEKIIGQVLSPVCGIGRLAGNSLAPAGRLSSCENGRMDISAAPAGKAGGFQILLSEQGVMDIDLTRARSQPQCMVVSEFDEHDLSWEGMAPLFFGFLHPRYNYNDFKSSDSLNLLTSRVLVEVRMDKGAWQPLPSFTLDGNAKKPLPEWARTALQHVTHIRILLPVPPEEASQP